MFRNGDDWYGNFQGNFPENLEIVGFPKSEPFNRNFWGGKSNWTIIPGKKFSTISVYLARLSSFRVIPPNVVPFVSDNFRKFMPDFFIECKGSASAALAARLIRATAIKSGA